MATSTTGSSTTPDPTSPGVPMSTMTLDTMFRPALPVRQRACARRRRALDGAADPPWPGRGARLAWCWRFAIGVFVTAAGSVATQEPGTPEPTRIVRRHRRHALGDRRRPRRRRRRAGHDGADRAAQRPRVRDALRRPAPGGPRRRERTSDTDFVSRLDPGWRAGEEQGRGRGAPPLRPCSGPV